MSAYPAADQAITLLLIESDRDEAARLRDMLEGSNSQYFEITDAASVDDALLMLRELPYDAVLLDISLLFSLTVSRCLFLGGSLIPGINLFPIGRRDLDLNRYLDPLAELEQRRAPDALLLDIGNIDAGYLDNNLVITTPLDIRLGNPERVNAVGDDANHAVDYLVLGTGVNR